MIMTALRIFLVISSLILAVHLHPDGELTDVQREECDTVIGTIIHSQFKNMIKCSKQIVPEDKEKEKGKYVHCILRCVLIKVGILDDHGQPKWDQRDFFLKKFFPDYLIEHANRTLDPCMVIASESVFKPVSEDEFCNSYEPSMKCAVKTFPNMCKL